MVSFADGITDPVCIIPGIDIRHLANREREYPFAYLGTGRIARSFNKESS